MILPAIPDYRLIGSPRKQRSRGVESKNYVQRWRYEVDPPTKVRVVSLQTADAGLARKRAVAFVEKAIQATQPKSKDDQYAKWAVVPLADQIENYTESLLADGRCAAHVACSKGRIVRMIAGCNIHFVNDVDATTLKNWIAKKRKAGWSQQTSQHYLKVMKAYTRWLWRADRVENDPMARTSGTMYQGDITQTFRRRAFSPTEFALLLGNAKDDVVNPVVAKTQKQQRIYMHAIDRIHLYLVASGTGFRASELASLTPSSFHLSGTQPYIQLAATVSKRRRHDRQLIQLALAERLRPYLDGKPKDEVVWPGAWANHAASMLLSDMAGIDRDTREGRLGFHSLRHTFITNVVNNVSNSQLILEICRLSTPLLLRRYFHGDDQQRRAAIESLPTY